MTVANLAAPIILVLVYGGVAIGRIPGLGLDRAGIAFLGGAAMIACGGLSLDEAFRAIDWDTIALLLGMMIVVAHLKVSGAFRGLGALAVEHAHAPMALLIATTLLAGLLSAFLVNDAICLVMAPIVVRTTRALGRNPLPYLVATATASNCGSVATITGNPQNMVIGALSGISYVGVLGRAGAGRRLRPSDDGDRRAVGLPRENLPSARPSTRTCCAAIRIPAR